MGIIRSSPARGLAVPFFFLAAVVAGRASAADAGFVPIFDGKTLDG